VNAAFRIWASLVSLAVIVQVGLAAYGGFHAADVSDDKGVITKHGVEHGFNPHSALGYLIVLGGLVLLILAFFARRDPAGTARPKWAGILFGLLIVQVLLAWLGGAVAGLGVLHGMNALAVAGVAGSLAGREWAMHRAAPTAPQAT
jgi:hypothetical protein